MLSHYIFLIVLSLQIFAVVPVLLAQRGLKGTTLTASAAWAVPAALSWPCVTIIEFYYGKDSPLCSYLLYATSVLTICPFIMVLGAKRPGHRAWHFVVAVLFVVLMLPCLQAPLRARNLMPLYIEDIWTVLFVGITSAGLFNYIPTFFCWPCCLAALCLFQIILPLSPWSEWSLYVGAPIGPLGIALSTLWAWFCAHRLRKSSDLGWNGVWINFRNMYGLAWSKRIQQRFNLSAQQLDWPIRLNWKGFFHTSTSAKKTLVTPPDRSPTAVTPEIIQACDFLSLPGPMRTGVQSLLNRFVTDAWISHFHQPGTDHIGHEEIRSATRKYEHTSDTPAT